MPLYRLSAPAEEPDNRSLDELAVVWEGVGRLIPAHAELIKVVRDIFALDEPGSTDYLALLGELRAARFI